MFARKGKDLLKEVAQCEPGHLPPHNEDLVRQVVEEVKEHHSSMINLLSEVRQGTADENWDAKPEDAASVIIHHESLLRNKRLLLAYTNARLQKVKDVRWRLGPQLPDDIKENCSQSEREFFKSYNSLLVKYQRDVGKGRIMLDLTVDKEPPQDPLILVRVVEEQGDIMVNGKQMCLQVGSVHRMERDMAEPLIAQGHLMHIDTIM
mmetsp:Transcript_49326/g.157960  ORF Transcript_49326/g.157960 Transcript_49326/m.157960 type:complete len:206 (+) Transcript_49326:135-752(+)|eukprot:CAMPEP_0182868514 /NCGR_PEP_ID=MMETSP0034_2-20130328/9367_1 /TAXON_ID=156128 /ORGANISM="Nephroselmis pyriformis, Strain CCMP717" /LENGTH=205 /DNA_ID=CAMNT_0025000925 /DNA_START=84 /DNA_END=701 /DNA_ORIENTATION=+